MQRTPKLSALECKSYFISRLSISANPAHDQEKKVGLAWDDVKTEAVIIDTGDSDLPWQVNVQVQQQNLPVEKNAPYHFAIEVVGFFRWLKADQSDSLKETVFVHAASMLYGVAREVLRENMARGPFSPMILPTVNFMDGEPARPALPKAQPKPVSKGKKTGTKK